MIKTLLTSLTGKVGVYLLVAAIAGGGIYVFIQETRIGNLTDNLKESNDQVATLSVKVATQDSTIATMSRQYEETVQGTRQLNSEVARLREEQNEIEAQYNEYRGRLAKISAKKPGLVERLANNAFSDVLRNFEEATRRDKSTEQEQSNTDTRKTSEADTTQN